MGCRILLRYIQVTFGKGKSWPKRWPDRFAGNWPA